MSSATMRATTAGRARRRPKTYGESRVCESDACDTRLSRYNRNEYCFQHAPVKFPRMRGEFTEEYLAKQSS
jgi:hypothetical protein